MGAIAIAVLPQIIQLVMEFGIPAVMGAIVAMNKEVITLDDIQKLRTMIKPPEQY